MSSSLKTFKSYLLSQGQSTQTAEGYTARTLDFINWCEDQRIEAEQATYNELLGYIKYLQGRGLKQITVRHYVGGLKHYYAWLVKRQIIETNPARSILIKGIKRRELYHILSLQELEQLYEVYPMNEHDPKYKNLTWYDQAILSAKRNRVMLGLMIWQGIKTEELQKLRLGDLRLREGKITIPGTRKSNEREMTLQAVQIMDLMEYTLQVRLEILKKSGSETDYLFITPGGSNQVHNAFLYINDKLKQINPNYKNVKQIRASVITHWLKNHNLRQVQYMAGHRYVSSTEGYFINDLDGLQEDITKYHPIG